MSKFLEITKPSSGLKVTVAIDKIIYIEKLENGTAFICDSKQKNNCYGHFTKESYEEVISKIKE